MFGFKLSRNPSRRKVFKDRRDRITSVGSLFFFFYKNVFYKNIEAEICKILRIF